jgi:hypothetical protein
MSVLKNPFITGTSVSAQDFVGRAKEIRRIVGRICSGGQSVAVVGEPRIGKTSLLRFLTSPEKRQDLYGDLAGNLIFQYIDAETLGATFTQAQFWRWVLTPLVEKLPELGNPGLTQACETCEKEGYSVYFIEKLLGQLSSTGLRLILILDEFDILLNHPVLNGAEFYGSLRSLDTRCDSMALIIASRQSIEALNSATYQLSGMGSPYFNYMTPVHLGAFTDKDAQTLLMRGDAYFTPADKEYLVNLAGGHPFLLQTAAFALWEAYEDESDEGTRCEATAHELLEGASVALTDTWRLWSPETRKAVTIIALDLLPSIVKGKEFDLQALIASLGTYTPEIDELKKRGILVADPRYKSGYNLQAQVMLGWLAGELVRVARSGDDDYLSKWQRDQQLEGLIKGSEKSQFKKALDTLAPMLKTGTTMAMEALINAAVGKVMHG